MSNIIPCFRYDDAHAAISFLCEALGFERRAVYADDDGGIAHAQLVRGTSMIMLASARATGPYDALAKPPSATSGINTATAYIVVTDIEAAHAKAISAGAEVVIPPTDEDYGGRGFTIRDPEGHLWNLGSYNPWA